MDAAIAAVIETNAATPTVLRASAHSSRVLSASASLTPVISSRASTPTVISSVGSPAVTGAASGVITVPFQWNNVTLLPLAVVRANRAILKIDVCMTQAINGVSPTLSIGVPGDYESIVGADAIDPSTVNTFSSHPGLIFDVDTTIYLRIDHGIGASEGEGVVSIFLQQ